jgi:hypothetical protein
MRRLLLAIALFFFASPVKAEDVYYVKSRLTPYLPKIGPLYHASVVVCPEGEPPAITDGKCAVSNPALTYYGLWVGRKGFQVENRLLDVKVIKVETPPEGVKERLQTYDKKWALFTNCQVAAAYATNKKTAWRLWR